MSNVSLCRLCAQSKSDLIDVNSSPDGKSLIELIQHYLVLQINVTDLICQECNYQLLTFHQFVGQVHDAQDKFINKYENEKENSADKALDSDTEYSVKIEKTASDDLINEEVKIEDEWHDMFSDNDFLENFEISDRALKSCRKSNEVYPSKLKCENEVQDNDVIIDDFSEDDASEESEVSVRVLRNGRKCKEAKQKKPKINNKKREKTKLEQEIKTNKRKQKFQDENFKIDIVNNITPSSCYICKEIFTNVLELKNHQTGHLGANPASRWPCIHCERKFKSQSEAISHIRYVHDRIYDHICHECGKMFSSKGAIKEHLVTHSTVLKYECSKCEKKFKRKASLKHHLETHDTNFHQCSKCPLLLKTRKTLRNHMLTHEEVGRKVCPFCDKRFKLGKTLKHHLNQHTGERPYECTWCIKTFTNNSNLRIHKKRVHKYELLKYEEENNIDNVKRFARHAHILEPSDVDANGRGARTKNKVKSKRKMSKNKIAHVVESENALISQEDTIIENSE